MSGGIAVVLYHSACEVLAMALRCWACYLGALIVDSHVYPSLFLALFLMSALPSVLQAFQMSGVLYTEVLFNTCTSRKCVPDGSGEIIGEKCLLLLERSRIWLLIPTLGGSQTTSTLALGDSPLYFKEPRHAWYICINIQMRTHSVLQPDKKSRADNGARPSWKL